MSNHHHDENCGHESHDDHDHETNDLGARDSLFQYIDRPNVIALNASGSGPEVIKPWHQRMDEEKVELSFIGQIH